MSDGRAIVLDDDIARVLYFMEKELPADRLEYVAARLPAIARVIWSAERCGSLARSPIRATQLDANGYVPVEAYVGDDSAAVVGVDAPK